MIERKMRSNYPKPSIGKRSPFGATNVNYGENLFDSIARNKVKVFKTEVKSVKHIPDNTLISNTNKIILNKGETVKNASVLSLFEKLAEDMKINATISSTEDALKSQSKGTNSYGKNTSQKMQPSMMAYKTSGSNDTLKTRNLRPA